MALLLADIRKAVQAEVLRAGKKLPSQFKLDHYINLAGRAFLTDTKIRRSNGVVATTTHGTAASGHHTFTLHEDLLDVVEVYYDGDKLIRTSREELSVFDPDWQSASDGTPNSYYITTGKRARVYPPVVLANATKVSSDLALGWTTDMTVSDNDPDGTGREIPDAYHMALVYWAANKLAPNGESQRHYQDLVNQARLEVAKNFEDVDLLAAALSSQGKGADQD